MPSTIPSSPSSPDSARHRLSYGLDAPNVLRTFLIGGLLALIAGFVVFHWRAPLGLLGSAVAVLLFWVAFWMLLTTALMVIGSVYGKERIAKRVLDSLALHGNEAVLDIGCGRGLMLIGAAQRLVPGKGKAIGVDVWLQRDQWHNSRERTMQNVEAAGVADRVEVRDADMRALPFPDASIDVVVSSLAIHNLARRRDRKRAIHEIVRVLKPGGVVAIIDIARTREYAKDFRAHGMRSVQRSGRTYWIYPPARFVTATRREDGKRDGEDANRDAAAARSVDR